MLGGGEDTVEDDAFVIDVPDSRCQQMPESSAALELKKKSMRVLVIYSHM